MILAEGFSIDRERPLVKRLRFAVLMPRVVECPEIHHGHRDVRVLLSERLLPDRKRALIEFLGLLVLAPPGVRLRQIAESARVLRMICPDCHLPNGYSLLKFLGRRLVFSSEQKCRSDIVVCLGRVGMYFYQGRFAKR